MTDSKAPLRAAEDFLSETVRTDTNDDIPSSAWEVALSDEQQAWSRELATTANDMVNIECDSRPTETIMRKMDKLSLERKFHREKTSHNPEKTIGRSSNWLRSTKMLLQKR